MNEDPESNAEVTWRSWYGLPIALVVLHATLGWMARALGVLIREDDVRYLVLGRALKLGQYRELWMPGSPAHHMYPPGYPALLSAWTAIGGAGYNWLVLLQILLSIGTLSFTFDALRRVVRPSIALGSLCILAVNPHLIEASGKLMSESPLALCFAMALWANVRLPRGRRQSVILLTVAVLAPLMRMVGIALPIALVIDWILARRYRDALLAIALFAITIGPLIAWTLSDPVAVIGNSYAGDLTHTALGLSRSRTIINRVFRNGYFYLTQGLPVSMPAPTIQGTLIDNMIVTGLIVAILVMSVVPSFRRIRIALLGLMATAVLLTIWPWPVVRYVVPTLPWLVPVMLLGIERLGTWYSPRATRIAIMTFVLVIATTGVVESLEQIALVEPCDRALSLPDSRCVLSDQASFFRLVQFVNDSLPPNAKIVAAKAAPLFYYTNRLSLPAMFVTPLDSVQFWSRLRDEGLTYVVLGALHSDEWRSLARHLLGRCTDLRLVASFPPRTYLFLIDPPSADLQITRGTARDQRACVAIRRYQHDRLLNQQ